MKIFSALLLLLIVGLAHANVTLPSPSIQTLDKADRINLVSIYSDFLISLENIEGPELLQKSSSNSPFKKFLSSFFAYASDGNACIYAGWPSSRGQSGYCDRPETVAAYNNFFTLTESLGFKDGSPSGFQVCRSDQRMCNPVVFGPVCAPFDTTYNRVRATSNCDKVSKSVFPKGFDYNSYLAENISEEEGEKIKPWFESQFSELQGTAQSICNDRSKKQSRTAVCRVLEDRLGADFPYHSQASLGPSDEKNPKPNFTEKSKKYSKSRTVKNTEPISEKGLKNLEFSIQELNLNIERLLQSKECTDPSVAVVVNKRYNTIQLVDPKSGEFLSDLGSECLKKLKPLLANRTKILNEYEKSFNDLQSLGCEPEESGAAKSSVTSQANEINSIVAKKVCEENPQKWTAKGCGKDFACAIGSSLFYGGALDKVGAVVGDKLGFSKGCLNSQNNCVAKIASAAADVIWSFLKSLPALAGMAWDGMKWVGNKVYSWMPWVTETEKKMSDAGQAAMSTLGEDEESTLTKIGNFFSSMWKMLEDYVTDDLMCTEPGWEVERFKTDAHCDQPFVSWKCLTCAGAISGVCNVVGAIGSEFLIGLLTGGTANVAKSGVRSLSLGVKVASRSLLKKQMTTLAGKALQNTAKIVVKTSKVLKAPLFIARSVQRKSTQFLKIQKGKFTSAQAWVGRNANKVFTPITSRSPVLKNVVELSIEGTGKTVNYLGKTAKTVASAPFKLPGAAIKVVGRVLDPLKLGEKGFALGFQVANGLMPMANFMRITEFSYDLANMTGDISKATSASKAVDHTLDLLNRGGKQMDAWLQAAQKGQLTQTEFKQLQEMLSVVAKTKIKYAGDLKAIARLNTAEREFLEREEIFKQSLGEGSMTRYMAYSKESFSGLEKGKVRNLRTGAETQVESFELLRKESKDLVIISKPSNERLLVLDVVDGQFVAYTSSGEQVLVSSGNLGQDANKLISKKLNAQPLESRFADAQDLFKDNKGVKVESRIDVVQNSDELTNKSIVEKTTQKVKTKLDNITAPMNHRLNKSALKNQIQEGKTAEGFIENAEKQALLEKQLVQVKDGLVTKAKVIGKENLADLSKEMLILDEAKKVSSNALGIKIDTYKDEIIKSLKDDASRARLANINRGPAQSGNFGEVATNNVSVYSSSEFKRAYDAKIAVKVDESGAYIRLDKNESSEGIRIVDESTNSFMGYNSDGQIVHIKKSSVESKLRLQVSESISSISPIKKEEILNKVKNFDKPRVFPKMDPDFKYSVQLAKNEIRIGDEIVPLRKWQAGSTNLKENIIEGGAVSLKSKQGLTVRIENVREHGNYWIGSTPDNKRVLLPKYLLDANTNKLMARGRNFTKFKRNVKKNLSFISGYNKQTKQVTVSKAFKSKYKYSNYFIKYNLTKEAISEMDVSTLEKISENVYLKALGDDEAELLYVQDEPISEEEQKILDTALEKAVTSDEDYNFENINTDDLDF